MVSVAVYVTVCAVVLVTEKVATPLELVTPETVVINDEPVPAAELDEAHGDVGIGGAPGFERGGQDADAEGVEGAHVQLAGRRR